jgi:hydrophobic/amphiphilic exporter-1 (mainly G- bacteria), HAE1 family
LPFITIFLKDGGAKVVPPTTVPITVVGSFAAMAALGFSVNLLTLFALVLCIGIVVDDAIVVVEGVAKHVEEGKPPREAAIEAMRELLGPIIGITLVLMAVFLPAAFIPGITGQMYKQFALVIAATALLSGINAITLKPTQSAQYVRAHPPGHRKNAFYRGFDAVYYACERAYVRMIGRLISHSGPVLVVGLALIGAGGYGLAKLPTAFIPTEDQGYLLLSIQLPDAASIERTEAALQQVVKAAKTVPGVQTAVAVGGVSALEGNASLSSAGLIYLTLRDWSERGKGEDLRSIYMALSQQLANMPSLRGLVLVPPPIPGLGLSGGFQMQLLLTDGSGDLAKLRDAAETLIEKARARPEIQVAFTPLRTEVPQLSLSVNRARAETLGVNVGDAFDALQSYLGASYVNQFSRFGQNFAVYVQAEGGVRANQDVFSKLTVKSRSGEMVPIGAFVDLKEINGPAVLSQYNLYPTAAINGSAGHGFSSGQALTAMEQLAREHLPPGVGFEWTAMSYQERLVGNTVVLVFALAILLVYFVLAGQYESWWSAIPVLLSVPLALVGTVGALYAVGLPNNIYVQIGLVLLIALSAKNAILIVEVAIELRHAGHSIAKAAQEASQRRFRPILMTSFAFILGVVPLVLAEGAGAAARKSIGIAVLSGMLASTCLAVAFVPVFYTIVERIRERFSSRGGPSGHGSHEAASPR